MKLTERICAAFFLTLVCSVCMHRVRSSDAPGDSQEEENVQNYDSNYDYTIEKKKNIPVVPPEASALHFRFENNNGEHPVIREFVSDRPKMDAKKKKKMNIPSFDQKLSSEEGNEGVSKRFDLYPKWYSQRIPTMFGKRFAKSYFHPFSHRQISSRDRIARRMPINSGVHELPMSWLQPQQKQSIGVNRRVFAGLPAGNIKVPGLARAGYTRIPGIVGTGVMPDIEGANSGIPGLVGGNSGVPSIAGANTIIPGVSEGNGELSGIAGGGNVLLPSAAYAGGVFPQMGSAVPELVDLPDEPLRQHGMRTIPYELMNRLNPSFYEPTEPTAGIVGNGNWQSYDDLAPGHYHRHSLNPCHHNPCLNHGKCHFSHRHHRMYHFKCVCSKTFSGHYCEISPYSCHPNPCQNGGTCTKTKSLVFCSCPPDFKGHHCEDERACLVNPCMNDGICTETNTGFHCQCQSTAFSGKTCEDHINVCDNNPCRNGGTCRDLEADGQFECTCPTGWGCVDCSCPIESVESHVAITDQSGVTHTNGIPMATSVEIGHQDISTHACPPDNCHNGGTCIRGSSGFLCNCPPGFHGLNCGTPDLCSPNPCENNGVCLQDGDENYKCICPYGFKGTDCQLHLSCSGHPCSNGATCIETTDSYHCKCTPGYKGLRCTEISPCSHNPCAHKATCFEKGTMYTCKCTMGYRGKTCHEKDPCYPNPCSNGQCAEKYGAVVCKCNDGWMGDMCDVEDLCHRSNHCLNGGTCVHRFSEFKCICPDGFKGETCELRLPCFDNPCENGGICVDEGDTFVCKCSTGYHGERCHLQSHCYPSPCENDGRCFESSDGFVCECPHSYIGKLCEEEKYCMSNPCLNGGHCTEVDDVFRCKCPLGFFGRVCDINVCDHNPCRNGGTCMPASNPLGYTCECVFPFHGQKCDEMDACMPNPCRHAGVCHSHLQHIQEMSYHVGPQFHGADESVVSVVGPIFNETVHHEPYYDSHDHSLKYTPDEHLMTNEVHHFHMTSDTPDHVYADQMYHAKYGDPNRYIDNSDFYNNHGITHEGLYPDHRLEDEMGSFHLGGYHVNKKRSFKSLNKTAGSLPTKRSEIISKKLRKQQRQNKQRKNRKNKRRFTNLNNNNLNNKKFHKKLQKRTSVQKAPELDRIPQVIVNIRDPKSSNVKRTIHDLYVCQCAPGFLGAHCQHINPCDSNPCHNHGICVPRGELYQCQCVNGFGGVNCDDPHPCTPNPCLHGGKCLLARTVHGYLCECPAEWRGNNCETQDTCALQNPCLHGGLCVNIEDGKVACKCRARFTGDKCEKDKCANCDIHAYCHHGNCVCKPGFVGNGFRCRTLGDICDPNPCDNGGVCKVGIDGKLFACECLHGFLGPRCELPNPCANSPCLNNGACIDASNSKDKGILMADRNDYKCFCTPGYRGKVCEELNLAACSSGPCQNNGYCFDASSESHKKHLSHPDDYECFCAPGFSGKNCEYEHYPCISSPCMNGGHCLDAQKLPDVNFDAHGYKCHCNRGFAGRNCEVTVDGLGACHSAPCMHDGRCVDIINNNDPDLMFDFDHEFKCFCSALYSGKLCEVPYPACHSSPCLHNGTCFDKTHDVEILFDDTGYECKCEAGYEGKNCERQYAMNIMDDNLYDHPVNLNDGTVFESSRNVEPPLHHLGVDGTLGHHPGLKLSDDVNPAHHPVDVVRHPVDVGALAHHPDLEQNEHHNPDVIQTHPVDMLTHHYPTTDAEYSPIDVHNPLNENPAPTTNPLQHAAAAAENVENGAHTTGNMDHLVLPNHSTTPQPVIDTVAHHPINPMLTNEKFDFPLRNPSPTMPIMLKGEENQQVVAGQYTDHAIARNFKEAYLNYKKAQDKYMTSSRVIYGQNGRRSGIAK